MRFVRQRLRNPQQLVPDIVKMWHRSDEKLKRRFA
jgi:hypothetical protein